MSGVEVPFASPWPGRIIGGDQEGIIQGSCSVAALPSPYRIRSYVGSFLPGCGIAPEVPQTLA